MVLEELNDVADWWIRIELGTGGCSAIAGGSGAHGQTRSASSGSDA
jgi:hypothetical protein